MALAVCYGLLAVSLADATYCFWGLAWLVLAAVEFCLCLLGFIVLSELQGLSTP